MNKAEVADAALRASGVKRIHDDALAKALTELDDVLFCSGYDVDKPPSCVADEITQKLVKRLSK